MRRINIKKVLKTVAIALIAMPEPFTTPVGIVMLGLVLAIYHKTSLDRFGDLEGLIKRSLQKTEPVGFSRYLSSDHVVIHHRAKQPVIMPQNSSWFDNRTISASTLHHTLRTSFPQYEAAPGSGDMSDVKVAGNKNIKPAIEYHKLKTCL